MRSFVAPVLTVKIRSWVFGWILGLSALFIADSVVAAPGEIDTSFSAGANNNVLVVSIQSDGKYLIGGQFTVVNGVNRNYCARLRADGTLDTSFNFNFNNYVRCFAAQPDGKILIGGHFSTVDGENRTRLIRLNADGTLDQSFNVQLDNSVLSIVLQPDGKILIGGSFNNVDSVSQRCIARLNTDGSLDTTFSSYAASGSVNGLHLRSDGRILLWGSFQTVNGTPRRYLAQLKADGSLDPDFNPAPNSFVYSASEDLHGRFLIGGSFTSLTDPGTQAVVERSNLARFKADGSIDDSFSPRFNQDISTIQVQADGKILVAGNFTTIDSNTVTRLGRLNDNGTLDTSFYSTANDHILSTTLMADGSIMIGGSFTEANEASVLRVARVTNDPVVQSLTASEPNKVQWQRGGTAPHLATVQFKLSVDGGVNWSILGIGSPVIGGWALEGVSLPASGLIRAEGYSTGGRYNGTFTPVQFQGDFAFTPLQLWRFTHFGTSANSGLAADDADPDGDGIVNLAEYAFGHHPKIPSAHLMPAWSYSKDLAILNFPRPSIKPGVTYKVEISSTLHSDEWEAVADVGNAAFSLFLVPTTGTEKLFMRMGVAHD